MNHPLYSESLHLLKTMERCSPIHSSIYGVQINLSKVSKKAQKSKVKQSDVGVVSL